MCFRIAVHRRRSDPGRDLHFRLVEVLQHVDPAAIRLWRRWTYRRSRGDGEVHFSFRSGRCHAAMMKSNFPVMSAGMIPDHLVG
jgi:hypothetical protein